ncbi:MAG: DoxX family protein [Acidobacteria bacterium]|nr:DoxX family protein [Acidobacteriota bacterium]
MKTTALSQTARPGRALHVSLWILQIVLAVAFGIAGLMKLTRPIAALTDQMAWVTAVPPLMVRFIGLSELAGALGLVLPAATGVKPGLTPLAALGLAVVMALALGFHVSRGEYSVLPINIALGGLAAFIAWGRWR